MRITATVALFLLSSTSFAFAQPAAAPQRSAWERRDGYIPFHWDAARGRVLLEITRCGQDILYYTTTSNGQNPAEYAPKSSALPQPPGARLGAR